MRNPPPDRREVFLGVNIRILQDDVERAAVPSDEREVRDGGLAPNEPLLLREHAFEHGENTLRLLLVPLDRARQFLRVVLQEPVRLAEVRSAHETRSSVSKPTSFRCIAESKRTPGLTPGRRATAGAYTCPSRPRC